MTTPYDFRHPSRAKHADSPDPTVVIIAHHDHDHSPSHGSNRSVPVSSRSFHAESETKHSPPDGVQTSTSESGDDCIDRRHSYDAEQEGRTVSSKKTPRPPVSIILTRALTADERKLKLDIEPESLTLSHTLNSDSSTRNLHHPTLALDTVWVTRPSKVTTPLPPSPSSHSFCYPLTTLLRDVFGVQESDSFLLCLWRLRTLWAFLLIMALFVVAMALLLFTAEHPEPGRCPVGCVRQDCRVTPDQPILPCFCNDDTTCADLDTSNAMTSSPKGIAAIWLFGVAGSLCVIWGVLRIFSSCQSRPR